MNQQSLVLGPEGLRLLRAPKGSLKISDSAQKSLSSLKERKATLHCKESCWEHTESEGAPRRGWEQEGAPRRARGKQGSPGGSREQKKTPGRARGQE